MKLKILLDIENNLRNLVAKKDIHCSFFFFTYNGFPYTVGKKKLALNCILNYEIVP